MQQRTIEEYIAEMQKMRSRSRLPQGEPPSVSGFEVRESRRQISEPTRKNIPNTEQQSEEAKPLPDAAVEQILPQEEQISSAKPIALTQTITLPEETSTEDLPIPPNQLSPQGEQTQPNRPVISPQGEPMQPERPIAPPQMPEQPQPPTPPEQTLPSRQAAPNEPPMPPNRPEFPSAPKPVIPPPPSNPNGEGDMRGTGRLIVNVTAGAGLFPVEGATVIISDMPEMGGAEIVAVKTDNSGKTPMIYLPAPLGETSQQPQQNGENKETSGQYTITVSAPGYVTTVIEGVSVFDDVTAIQKVDMLTVSAADGSISPRIVNEKTTYQL